MLEHKIDKNKFVDFCNGDVKGEDTETLNHFDEHTRYQFTRMLYAYGTGMTGPDRILLPMMRKSRLQRI